MAKVWTHAALCKKAVGWLRRSHSAGGCGCPNAYSEVQSGSNGHPYDSEEYVDHDDFDDE